jgi:acyl-CoA thioester hydrolase
MEGFNFTMPVEVRFRDVDSMGHVNNAVIITYLETARIKYMLNLADSQFLHDLRIILAEVTCTYRSPAYWGETLQVGVRITEVGNKSFAMEYRIEEQSTRRLVATAHSVQVAYDYESQASVSVPDSVVVAAEEFEGRSLRRTD